MPSWAEFEAEQPEFAARVRKLMESRKHLTPTLTSDRPDYPMFWTTRRADSPDYRK